MICSLNGANGAVRFGYIFVALNIFSIATRIIVWGTQIPPKIALIENGTDALMALIGMLGIVIGTKLKKFRQHIDPLKNDNPWQALTTQRYHTVVLYLGYVLFVCGGVEKLASFMLANHPRSEIQLLVDSLSILSVTLGLFLIFFANALGNSQS